jgi:hypothetical protein
MVCQPAALYAQAGESLEELKKKAAELTKQQKYTEPYRDKLRRYVVEYILTGGGK